MTDAPDHRSVVDEVAEDLRDNGYVVTTSQALDRMTIYRKRGGIVEVRVHLGVLIYLALTDHPRPRQESFYFGGTPSMDQMRYGLISLVSEMLADD